MSVPLPPRPDLEHLRKQAKDLIRAHRAGDAVGCALLRALPRLADATDDALLAARVTLHDAQHALALHHGFDDWTALRTGVESPAAAIPGGSTPTLAAADPRLRAHVEALGFATLGAYRVWCRRQGLPTDLDKSDAQLESERALHAGVPERPTPRPDFRPAEARKLEQAFRGDTEGLWNGWLRPFEGVDDPAEREALHRVLQHCLRYAAVGGPLVWPLARHHRDWRQPVEDWVPRRQDAAGQLRELTGFLLGWEDLPADQVPDPGVAPSVRHAEVAARRATVLDADEVAHYETHGYVRVPGAFDADGARRIEDFLWAQLDAMHGFHRDDPDSWRLDGWDPDRRPYAWTQLRLNRHRDDAVFEALETPRLLGALEELGRDIWPAARQPWGAFTPTFPSRDPAPWDVPVSWSCYPDTVTRWRPGAHTLFTPVVPRGGARLVVAGSHRLVRAFIDGLPGSQRLGKLKPLVERFTQGHPYFAELTGRAGDGSRVARFVDEATEVDGVALRVVELTGEAGDAFVIDRSSFCAMSRNLTDRPVLSRA